MATNPSVENYTLGRGRLFFAPYDNAGALTGERALGNAPAFTFNMAIEKLEHYSSMTGLKAKDKSVVTQVTPALNFTLDELSDENMNMLFFGTSSTITQAADDYTLEVLTTSAELNRYYQVATEARNIGIYKFTHGTITGTPFVVDEILTGTASTETATVRKVVDANTVYISGVSGSFTAGEEVTGSVGSGTADLDAGTAEIWDTTDVVVFDGTSTYYDMTTDYTIDSVTGRVKIVGGGAITAGTAVSVIYGTPADSYTKLAGLKITSIEGQLRFVSDYPEGPNMTLTAWKVNLTPDGDTAFIGDDWSTISFTGEVLADEAGHPASPYLEILL